MEQISNHDRLSVVAAARAGLRGITHDPWSLVVLIILVAIEFPLVRACAGQRRAEASLRSTPYASLPSSVPFFATLAVLLPLGIIIIWVFVATAAEWWRSRRPPN